MKITRKDAAITNTGPDDEFPGSFQVVLSTSAKDRDGDELATEDWKQPLPEHITFDVDHGMSVEKTIGSGRPYIDEQGRLLVDGTYSSLPLAQDTRTLVKEGHIRTTSVAFMSEKLTKDGKTRTVRELLNGAFVAIPSNREAVVLSAKAGARHNAADHAHIQAIYEHALALGAGPMDDTQAEEGAVGGKTIGSVLGYLKLSRADWDAAVSHVELKAKYTAEQERAMLAQGHALRGPNGEPDYPIGDVDDLDNAIRAVGRGNQGHDSIRAYIIRRAAALGHSDMIPDNWNADGSLKAATGAETKDAASLAQGVDASLDEACNLLHGVDMSSLPEPVAQALGLITAAAETVDELLDAMGVDNPDEPDEDASDSAPAAAKSAAPAADTDGLDLRLRAFNAQVTAAG